MPEAIGLADARQRRAWRVGGALILCVLVAAVAVAWNDLRVRREAGERYVQALVDSHARQVAGKVDSIERSFRGLADILAGIREVAPDIAPGLARKTMADITAGNPRLRDLGVETTAPAWLPPGAHATRHLYLGTPGSGPDGSWAMPLAMLIGTSPSHALWLRANLDTELFSELLGAHELGKGGVASVLTADGMLIARSDTGTRHAGLDARHSPVFRAVAAGNPRAIESRSRMDGIRRIVAHRAVEGRPLLATVGMTPNALYGGWWTFIATLALGMLLLLAAFLVGIRFLRRAAQRESRMRRSIAANAHTVGHLRERVRDAEAQYRFLYQQHPLPAFVYDRETLVILEANDTALQQYGYSREAMLGMSVGALLGEGSVDDIRAEMLAYPHSNGRRIWVQRREDASTFSALVFARDLASFDERPARLVLSLDVTDRQRAEANLRLLRRAVEASEEGLFIVEGARRVLVYGNATFERLTGVEAALEPTAESAARSAIADAGARQELLVGLERAEDVRVEVAGVDSQQLPRWMQVRMSPVFDDEGKATHFVGVVTDITARRRAAEELVFRASHDTLTGLANRDRLTAAIDAALEDGDGLVAVCQLDLDRFELINDSLGHDVGDELLVLVARRLERAAGTGAQVARLGGDEFGILLKYRDSGEVPARVEALRAAVAATSEVRGIALHVTPSLGYACHPGDGVDGTTLLRAASQAGAQAKRLGRNRSVGYRPDMDSQAGNRLALVQALHQALERDEFELVFQLQFGAYGTPHGMEALVRWRHPERGLLGPDAFMAACEDSGLVLPLGRWVLREAARCWRRLEACGWGALRMAVNISALQFQERLVEDVAQVLAQYRLPRGALELELTESVLLASPDGARRDMEALSALGVSLAIDDFGTGYSSLAYLKHLPLQRLKLDRSFVHDLGRDPDNEAICIAVLRMAQGLGLRVVAEGVETRHQHDWLLQRGCEEFQGFLLARPAAFDVVLERLGDAPSTRTAGEAAGLA
ncbi:EAL domain-containing protein [Luteimonas sp. MC1825]|uniref:bifunctional diguanylate cyclase/phosphodiesterase n=1 Tax=Luteimonas sp. MC1825 TaxID=2761107 RepID=UPI00161DDE3B|nr:EAL domain-containing protein [Luteimonas sp. MC1825]MBB6600396.1 EAL domain-containing protein [Luteimonas sp. MC1825]QOC88069.1 EAL domain-containing protein [Luteimonas sp. MC1825]